MVKFMFYAERIFGDIRGTFFEKCYICEKLIGMDAQEEHRIPKFANYSDINLEHEWNVFLACSRCNQKKSFKYYKKLNGCRYSYGYIGIIDCTKCDPNQYIKTKIKIDDIYEEIEVTEKRYAPCIPDTITLLKDVYGCANTIADIKLQNLKYQIREEVFNFYQLLYKFRFEVQNGQSAAIINRCKENIVKELLPESPFSSFKRTCLEETSENDTCYEFKSILKEIINDSRLNPNIEITCTAT